MEKKISKKVLWGGVFASIIVLLIGVSYALWQFITSQTNPNKIASTCLDISLTSETDAIKMENTFPITDEEGMKTSPYTFTITNTCNTFLSYEVILGMTNETTLKSEYIAAVLDTSAIETLNNYESTEVEGYKEARILRTGSLSSGDEVSYNLRLWMDEDVLATEDAMNKTFASKVIVRATVSNYSPVDQGFTTLADAMLVNEYQSTSVESAKAKIEAKQKPDFTKTAPIIDWQENHESTTTTTTATMPHPDLVGTGGIAANLTKENILPLIGTGYTFDSETGKYTLTGTTSVDPTTLDYNGDTKYYYCSASFSTNASDVITVSRSSSNCITMYQVIGATKTEGTTTGTGGTSIKTMNYQMTVYKYTQTEQENDKSDRGLYAIEDDYGTSYYYRGSVTNNYVKFADAYWRIIRQNGDGSVRLLYAGTTQNATGDNLQIGTSAFNSRRNNPGYVGYMYGNTFNASYEQTHVNENNSTIKTKLDNWYKENIVDKGLSNYIADSGFCNDRSLDSGDGVSTTAYTYFKGYRRYVNHTPSLVCLQQNDLFTVDNMAGNQALTYPIGLITVDELMLGGLAKDYLNRLSYTYSSIYYWTMTPSFLNAPDAAAYGFNAHFTGYAGYSQVTGTVVGIRPVINLASNVEIESGIGTANDPFVVG